VAFVGLKVPVELGSLFSQVEVPGRRESKDKYHVTILNMGKDVPIEQIGKASVVAFKVCEQTPPFMVTTKKVSQFPKGSDGVPIIALIESPALHNLQANLKKAFDKEGVSYSKKFPEFKPHVTLAYSDTGMPEQAIVPISWTVSDINLWGGDSGEERIVTRFPLSMDAHSSRMASVRNDRVSALRVAARYQIACEGGVCTCGGTCSCGKSSAKRQNPTDATLGKVWEEGGKAKFVTWANRKFLPEFKKALGSSDSVAADLFGEGVFDNFLRTVQELPNISKTFGYPLAGTRDDSLMGMWGQIISTLRYRHPDFRKVETPYRLYENDYVTLKGIVDTLGRR
jgi:2'-5' RNA ligase